MLYIIAWACVVHDIHHCCERRGKLKDRLHYSWPDHRWRWIFHKESTQAPWLYSQLNAWQKETFSSVMATCSKETQKVSFDFVRQMADSHELLWKIFTLNPNLYGVGGKFAPTQFFITAQKRLALECWNFMTFIVSLLHIIWYTFWSPGT